MAHRKKILRYVALGSVLLLAVLWSLATAGKSDAENRYPNGDFLVSAEWLQARRGDPDLIVVDVRADEHFDGRLIPGAIRLPWSMFRYDDRAGNVAELFVGAAQAQKILGEHGIGRTSALVLYDSVERDGGATASYLFWVLDVLGHPRMRILEGGIDAWSRAGYDVDSKPVRLSAVLYQAPIDDIRSDRLIGGDFVYRQLGDPYYQIVDVRSREEYSGEKGSLDLRGNPLKLGHIPTAVNVNYQENWIDKQTKMVKPYSELQDLYTGLDPEKGVIVYCDSGRRSSFSYFVLRLMGIANVYTYEASWKEWGSPAKFYPVETTERTFTGTGRPGASQRAAQRSTKNADGQGDAPAGQSGPQPKGGYVSCGG